MFQACWPAWKVSSSTASARSAPGGLGLPCRPAKPHEGIAVPPDLVLDDRFDECLRGVLPGYQVDRLTIGGKRGRPNLRSADATSPRSE